MATKQPDEAPVPVEQQRTCNPPEGYALVPVSPPGILWVDGLNVSILAFPANPNGQHLAITPQGPAWANQ